jgi:hypothetical protein
VVVDGDGDGDEIAGTAGSAPERPEPGGLWAAGADRSSVAVAVAVNHHVNEVAGRSARLISQWLRLLFVRRGQTELFFALAHHLLHRLA